MKRFIVNQRSGIVAVIDTEHPLYEVTPGLQSDYKFVLASWQGIKTWLEIWKLDSWKIEKANNLCKLLNNLYTIS